MSKFEGLEGGVSVASYEQKLQQVAGEQPQYEDLQVRMLSDAPTPRQMLDLQEVTPLGSPGPLQTPNLLEMRLYPV